MELGRRREAASMRQIPSLSHGAVGGQGGNPVQWKSECGEVACYEGKEYDGSEQRRLAAGFLER